eukprot:jgi/Psemu1/45746/gm1.45746_g
MHPGPIVSPISLYRFPDGFSQRESRSAPIPPNVRILGPTRPRQHLSPARREFLPTQGPPPPFLFDSSTASRFLPNLGFIAD